VFAVDEEPVALRIQWGLPAGRKSELIGVPELASFRLPGNCRRPYLLEIDFSEAFTVQQL